MEPLPNSEVMVSSELDVLFVDDEALLLRALKRALEDSPYRVETASSAREGLLRLQEKPFDIIVSDYRMPGVDGVEFLSQTLDFQPKANRVLMTAFADLKATLRAINDAHVVHLLHKPVTSEHLLSVLNSLRQHVLLQRKNELLEARVRSQNIELKQMNHYLDALVRERTGALLDGLLAALEYRDSETQWHSRRVALYTTTMARMVGVEDESLAQISRGALLHDIGKIGIPDAIMLKPGKLTEEDWEIMRTHPKLGYGLLSGIDFLNEGKRIVLEHHERFDGAGYPNRLKGEDIFLGARLFSIADTFDAMTSDRQYRKALPYEVAYEEVCKHSGSQFDPVLVEVFKAIPRESWCAAVAVGQSRDTGSELTPETIEAWDKSTFARTVGTVDDGNIWFDKALLKPGHAHAHPM